MQRIVEKEKSFMSSMLNILVIIIAICLLLYMGFYSGMKDLYFQVIVGYESDHIQSSQSIIRELYDSKLKNLKSDAEKKAEMFSAEINQNNKVKQVEILKEIPLEKDYINYMYYSEGRLTSAYAEYGEYAEEFGIVEIIEKLEVGNTVINPYFDNNDNYVLTIASVCEKKGKKEAFLIQVDAYAMSRWIEDAYEYIDYGTAYVVDDQGYHIATAKESNYDWIKERFNSLQLVKENPSEENKSIAELESKALNGETGLGTYQWSDQTSYLAYGPLKEAPWGVYVGFYGKELMKHAEKISSITQGTLGLIVLALIPFMLIICVQLLNKDHLTGAPNKRKFMNLLKRKSKESEDYTVVALNIHNFKFFNENFGKKNGDNLLKSIAKEIGFMIDKGEFYCRDTNDLFYICMEGQDKPKIERRMNLLMDIVATSVQEKYRNYSIYFYCGAAGVLDCTTYDNKKTNLMSLAMLSLKEAKISGRNRIVFCYGDMYEKENMRNFIESNMYHALDSGQFKVYLQSKINLEEKDGIRNVESAEALVRWVTDDGTVISPGDFIPIFEENLFAVKLDIYMVEQVCIKIREWIDKGIEPVRISVNQTRRLFDMEDYVDRLAEIIEKYKIPKGIITLEILESLDVDNIDKINICIEKLKNIGFNISMDDFGSGFSSLNVLSELRIDELKVDREFFLKMSENSNAEERERREKIITHIMAIARDLKIDTVAEGIETVEQENLAKKIGFLHGQGFYYSRPIPVEEFEEKYINSRYDI